MPCFLSCSLSPMTEILDKVVLTCCWVWTLPSVMGDEFDWYFKRTSRQTVLWFGGNAIFELHNKVTATPQCYHRKERTLFSGYAYSYYYWWWLGALLVWVETTQFSREIVTAGKYFAFQNLSQSMVAYTRLRPFRLKESDRSFEIGHRYRKLNKHHLRLFSFLSLHSIGNAELHNFFVVIDIWPYFGAWLDSHVCTDFEISPRRVEAQVKRKT